MHVRNYVCVHVNKHAADGVILAPKNFSRLLCREGASCMAGKASS